MNRDVIVLRGAPGTGKSAVARRLMDRLARGVTIEVDVIRRMIHGVDWEDDQLHCDAIASAANAARSFLASGRGPVVFVDTLGFGRLEWAIENLNTPSLSVYSLVCREPNLSLRLWSRARGYRDSGNARKFNAHVMGEGTYRCGLIDTTWSTLKASADRILGLEGVAS